MAWMSPSRLPSARVLEERRREDASPPGVKTTIDRVVHAAGHHRLDAGAVRPRAEDVRRPACVNFLPFGSVYSCLANAPLHQ